MCADTFARELSVAVAAAKRALDEPITELACDNKSAARPTLGADELLRALTRALPSAADDDAVKLGGQATWALTQARRVTAAEAMEREVTAVGIRPEESRGVQQAAAAEKKMDAAPKSKRRRPKLLDGHLATMPA